MKAATIFLIALLAWTTSQTQAQPPASDIPYATLREAAGKPHVHRYHYTGTRARGVKKVMVGMFLFYKNFISSQDGQSCQFTPSCSEYSVEAIRTYGLLKGYAATFDRLTRCHGFSRKQYAHDPQTGLSLDPVQ
ncbi:putative membrane protein insertion efficiency factor [Catalinimonas alkaloidigena]|uniref:Putative membrane protein insertion efficiency factor n=1 Tax=Catalinimonas alkaloidigena TaxID=1075417 RepID=A0A1G9DJW4_9BACT|nr:membrane protein insertion efficiency factor YidD [Catalinimonas alkaloidigena]SDK64201.1 putative membrane protein insertion efficiency factor [Catalinimonas alkaloidigena]